jgi:hypothetical protein
MRELRLQHVAVEQMILTANLTGLPQARDRIQAMHAALDVAWRGTADTPALLPWQFKKAYESYSSRPH